MTFLHNKLKDIFQMILKSSEPRTDGCHFSQFTSISNLLKSIHIELRSASSNYHEIEQVHTVILLIWDDWLMIYSKVPSTYHERYEYRQMPSDHSDFERIIRKMLNEFLIRINEFVPRIFDFYQKIFRENRELIESVLKIGIQLPLEEMFEISQTRPDFPIRISVYHNEVDQFIKVYLWVILLLLKEGYDYNFEDGHLEDNLCIICCNTYEKDIVQIAEGCEHSYCRSCYSQALIYQKMCPLCRHEYAPIDISGSCNQAVAVFLEDRSKRDEVLVQMKSDEQRYLIQFFEKHEVNISNINLWRGIYIQALDTCGNLYTIQHKGMHKCRNHNGDIISHYPTKNEKKHSLCILHPTLCCMTCEGPFHVYRECGHIICASHLDESKQCCPVCSKNTYIFTLKLPEQEIGK